MHNPEIDCIEASLYDQIHFSFDCKKCNATIHLNEPSDAYPYKACKGKIGTVCQSVSDNLVTVTMNPIADAFRKNIHYKCARIVNSISCYKILYMFQ